jgi:hypothetical protein
MHGLEKAETGEIAEVWRAKGKASNHYHFNDGNTESKRAFNHG